MQTELFEGGHNLLTVRYVIHLSGVEGAWTSGWTITDTVTSAWVESEVSGERHRIIEEGALQRDVSHVYSRALSRLRAF